MSSINSFTQDQLSSYLKENPLRLPYACTLSSFILWLMHQYLMICLLMTLCYTHISTTEQLSATQMWCTTLTTYTVIIWLPACSASHYLSQFIHNNGLNPSWKSYLQHCPLLQSSDDSMLHCSLFEIKYRGTALMTPEAMQNTRTSTKTSNYSQSLFYIWQLLYFCSHHNIRNSHTRSPDMARFSDPATHQLLKEAYPCTTHTRTIVLCCYDTAHQMIVRPLFTTHHQSAISCSDI